MMRNRPVFWMLVLVFGAGLTGCAEKRAEQWDPVRAAGEASFEDVWQACLDSFEDRGLEIERQDRRFGIIQSKAVVGKQFFEFWRHDTANSDDLLLSSLHTVRRTVSINISKQGAAQFQVNVEVHAERAHIAGEHLDCAVEAFELLDRQGMPASASRRDYIHPRKEPVWVDLGREETLEKAIMQDIAQRLES